MKYPKNTAAVMRDLASVIEEGLLPIGYGEPTIDSGDAKAALRRYEAWMKKIRALNEEAGKGAA